ncbi:MAG: rhodanese-like domain-containing protein [Desulfobulbaceae bacterium]|nr:rhodanese-like domain-containing protein [Desulfobulbaceae bacterium]
MNWKSLFLPVENMGVEQARIYLEERPAADYQLLDVRQPKEYEAGHLAGAVLVPLKELPGRLGELDKEKPVIVYCASGNRSKAAAQLLIGKDFRAVYNLAGGIKAWDGRQVKGPESAGLEFFTGNEDYRDGVSLAYAMEDGLQEFYQILADRARDDDQRRLYIRLVGFEDKHKAHLLGEYRQLHGGELTARDLPGIMEGGRSVDDFIKRVEAMITTKRDILELAMMLETQALDLYSRMAQKSGNPAARDLFLRLSDEEKTHLSFLTDELEKEL